VANLSKRPTELTGPGNYWEALMNVMIAILKDDYSELK
jgi:hypothetical protein